MSKVLLLCSIRYSTVRYDTHLTHRSTNRKYFYTTDKYISKVLKEMG